MSLLLAAIAVLAVVALVIMVNSSSRSEHYIQQQSNPNNQDSNSDCGITKNTNQKSNDGTGTYKRKDYWERFVGFIEKREKFITAFSTVLMVIVTALVVLATCALYLATKDLVKGSNIASERQLRAYVSIQINAREYPPPPNTPNRYAISLVVTNGGKTWARNLNIRSKVVPRQRGIDSNPWDSVNWSEIVSHPMVLGPNQTLALQFHEIPFTDLATIAKGDKGFNYVVWAQYEDVISYPSIVRQTQLSQRLNADTEGPVGHISFSYLPTHNCSDDDCHQKNNSTTVK